jgi:hypothetical protein
MNVYDPSAWADPTGAVILFGTIALIVIWCMVKLLTPKWDDWLDERWGRGSIRDSWLLRDMEEDGGIAPRPGRRRARWRRRRGRENK